jgi:hypothetical protein
MAKVNIIPKKKSINIREYLRNYNKYNNFINDGFSFIITNKNKNIALLSPTDDVKEKYSLKELLKLRIKTKENNISQNIDKIVYGN